MRGKAAISVAIVVAALTQMGCRSDWNLTKKKCAKAIDEYYSKRPECLRSTPDPRYPALGNLCYGHRVVQSIDSFTPPWDGMPRTSHVSYHYVMQGVPAWALSAELRRDYPALIDVVTRKNAATDNLVGSGGKDGYRWDVIPPGHVVE